MTERSGQGANASPLQSDKGVTKIGDAVVSQIAGIAAQEVEKVQMGGGASAAVGAGGGPGGAAIDLTMAIEYGQSTPQLRGAARRNVINKVESLVGLRVTEVNITVNDVQVPEERPMLQQQEQTENMAERQEQRA